ncbi:IscA/HesB family protein [uncultured Desulfovibrio sp.]|uniref:IscA/HesB family protein n=1 Tax=uncultured Desulfovibrio sp. TaxID=167968 RepID=UPI00260FD70D|nr:IscA/HesB family protein [uncultured Desulfovibrio sp.]
MITLSEAVRKELEAYFSGKERQTIRVFLAPGGCSGPRLALALDEPGDGDTKIEQDGFAFCINTELLRQVKSLSIDLSYMGFTVTPEVPLPSSGESSCGGCCGSCGSQQ